MIFLCTTKATIDEVQQNTKWWYMSCQNCNKICSKRDDKYYCNNCSEFPKKQHLGKKTILSNVTYILKYLLRSC
jgi:Zn finger protein HypA/HybF involved in hydrogenase expression